MILRAWVEGRLPHYRPTMMEMGIVLGVIE